MKVNSILMVGWWKTLSRVLIISKRRSETGKKKELRKKLCLVIPSLQVGGMERVMSELADCFCRKNNLEVHLVLYGRKPDIYYKIPDNLIIHKPKAAFNDKFRAIASLGRMIYLRYRVKTIKPDSVLSFGEYWNSFVLLSLYGLGYPIYISDRCSPEKKFNSIHSYLRKWLYTRSSGIIAQTQKAKEVYYSEFKHSNIEVIGNPIKKFINKVTLTGKKNIVLSIGRLIETKHYDKLIEVFSGISAPGWKLVIVGGNAIKQNNMKKLKQLIHSLRLDDSICLTGSQTDVEYYFKQSKIFAFTSSSEGFPNVIGEALSSGIPVVAFDCVAGPSEMIINNVNGFLVPVFDWSMFKQCLQTLINDEHLRSHFAENSPSTVRKFSNKIIGQKYLDFLLKGDRVIL